MLGHPGSVSQSLNTLAQQDFLKLKTRNKAVPIDPQPHCGKLSPRNERADPRASGQRCWLGDAGSLSGHQLGRGPNLHKSGRSWPVGNVTELPKRMRSVSVEVARENKDGISSFL